MQIVLIVVDERIILKLSSRLLMDERIILKLSSRLLMLSFKLVFLISFLENKKWPGNSLPGSSYALFLKKKCCSCYSLLTDQIELSIFLYFVMISLLFFGR